MKRFLVLFTVGFRIVLLAGAPLVGMASAQSAEEIRIRQLLKAFTTSGPAWATLRVTAIRLVAQDRGQLYSTGLGPVWYADLAAAGEGTGYLMWDTAAPGRLVEFALDAPGGARLGQCLAGVPNLQQFPVPGKTAPLVASGCVPTAAADLVGYWQTHGFPQWTSQPEPGSNPGQANLESTTLRLRRQIPMQEFPDEAGYTETHMPLSGAMPEELARAIREDAAAHGVRVRVEVGPFSMATFKSEIEARRPVLLSCTVRLPRKPQLSWGHEVVGVGWAQIVGEDFVGVRDNFYPIKDSQTIRWIRADAFQFLLSVVPES